MQENRAGQAGAAARRKTPECAARRDVKRDCKRSTGGIPAPAANRVRYRCPAVGMAVGMAVGVAVGAARILGWHTPRLARHRCIPGTASALFVASLQQIYRPDAWLCCRSRAWNLACRIHATRKAHGKDRKPGCRKLSVSGEILSRRGDFPVH